MSVKYPEAARRHLRDGHILLEKACRANAGQLFGFSVECSLKALLVACGVPKEPDGSIQKRHRLRQHEPVLSARMVAEGNLVPDGRYTSYFSPLDSLRLMGDWSVDHRYDSEASLPLGSIANWERVALDALAMLEQARLDGVLL